MGELHAVTGAFGFSGSYIAERLLAAGHDVRTLTAHPRADHRLSDRISVAPLRFDADTLEEALRGVATLYNTYWVRFEYGETTFAGAVRNTEALLRAAERAGVRRIVHVSITNPSLASPLPYFSGKAQVEEMIRASSLSHAILRPAVLFGRGDVLFNNIAWILRRSPVFAMPGPGAYRLRPIFVDDLARLAVEAGARGDSFTCDAVGPEQMTFRSLVLLLKKATRSRSLVVAAPPLLALCASRAFGVLLRDVVLTPDEIAGLQANLLESQAPSTGATRLTAWLAANGQAVGQGYASELERHFR